MGHTGRYAQPDRFVIPQVNATQATVLQHDQIQAAADHLQLIDLKAMAKQLTAIAAAHFRDQGFIAGQRLREDRGA